MSVAVVVLAAGQGKRMKSDLPKVLHPFSGSTIIDCVLDSIAGIAPDRQIVVIGHRAGQVEAALAGRPLQFVRQTEQLGTGHAVMQAAPVLQDFTGTVLVTVGDVPLLEACTLTALLDRHRAERAACTLLTARFARPDGYGRIVRNADGTVQAIVEHRDASPEQLSLDEINSGILAFESEPLWQHIQRLSRGNAQAEYYLTDVVGLFREAGLRVAAYCVPDEWEVHGINSVEQLGELERIYNQRTPADGE